MTSFEGWALVELMGHRTRAGRVTEVEAFGTKLLRLDIPVAGEGEETEFVSEHYSGSAIYCLTPATEEFARALARRMGDPRPVAPMTHRLPSYAEADEADFHDIDDDDDRPF